MKALATFLAFSLLATAASAQAPLTNAEARAPAEPFNETLFGQAIDDPYRWMERADRAEAVSTFVRQSGAHTAAQLAALPGRARLRERIAAAMNAGVAYADLQYARGLTFYRRADPGAQLAKLVVRTADGRERVLYDGEADGRVGAAIGSYSVSPDARLIALNLISGGDEAGEMRFLEVATGNFLPDRVEPVWGADRASWLDRSTIVYTRLPPRVAGTDQMENNRLYLHRLGNPMSTTPLLGTGVPDAPLFVPAEIAGAEAPEVSDWVLAVGATARADSRVFVARRADVAAGRPNWRTIGGYDDRLKGSALIGDRLYLLTNLNAPTGAVLRVDLSRPGGAAQAVTIMPAGAVILRRMAVTRQGLYVLGQVDGLSRLFFLANGEGAPVEITLPMRGIVDSLVASNTGDRLFIRMQDYFTASRWYAVDRTAVAPTGLNGGSYALPGATQRREEAVSADGTRVPMDILLPPPGARTGPIPVLLEGYGAYGSSTVEPYYTGGLFGLLESGGGAAFCGTRGGGERGRDWHEAGREANKHNAHADLIACAERLIALGITTPDRLTVAGTSAGGLLAPPVAILRPDLFTGLVVTAGAVNPTRLATAENGSAQFAEMGDPRTERGFRALLSQDAYQMLRDARDLPDTLLVIGLNDRRVSPWMSAKFAARALERFGSRRLILIRTDPAQGHGVGSARQAQIEQNADVYAFVLSQAGAPRFGTR